MALDQVTSFLNSLKNADEAELKGALACDSKDGKLDAVVDGLTAVAKSKGFSFTSAELSEHISSLKTQYYTSPTVKVLFDSHCSSSCHIGSQLQAAR